MEDLIESGESYDVKESLIPNQNIQRVIITRSRTNKLTPCKKLASVSYNENDPIPVVKKKKNLAGKKRSNVDMDEEEVVMSPKKKAKKMNKGLSEYELQIQKNIEERKKMFEMLNFGDAKQELFGVDPNKRKRELKHMEELDKNDVPIKRGRSIGKTKRVKKDTPVRKPPIRTSLRERKATKFFDYQNENDSFVSSSSASEASESSIMDVSNESLLEMCHRPCRMRLRSQRGRREVLPGQSPESSGNDSRYSLTLKNTYVDQSSIDVSSDFVKEIIPFLQNDDSDKKVSMPNDLKEFVELMRTMESDVGITGLSGSNRISSMSWHPNPTRLILASANVSGSIGFWDINHKEDYRITAYDVHTAHVSGLSFDKFNPMRLFSTSKDGYVRLLDFNSQIFNEVYSTSESSKYVFPICHVQKDSSSLIVSRADGLVVNVDIRIMPTTEQQRFKCFNGKIVALSNHPLNENLIMASSHGGTGIYDLRNVKSNFDFEEITDPVIRFPANTSRISGSFFSPSSGKYALITGMKLVEVYDLQEGDAKCIQNWNSTLSQRDSVFGCGVWHPLRDDICIVTGSDDRIEMLSVPDGEVLHMFENRTMPYGKNSVVHVFHPSAPVLASGCGRISLHRPPISC